MKRVFATAVALWLTVGCKPTPRATTTPASDPTQASTDPSGAVASADPLAGLDERVAEIMAAYDVPGLAIAVVKDDQVVVSKGHGLRERGKPDAVDADTVFAIASNTKAFLATAAALLEHEGKLDLDDRVVDHLPKFKAWDPYVTKELRVRDLMCHRSGLGTWAGDAVWIGSSIDTETLLKRLQHVPPSSSLRYRFGYTNLMFVVAGEVVKAVSGQPWDAFVKSRIIDPLGMTRTTTSVTALPSQQNVATPHAIAAEGQVKVPYLPVDNAAAAASINSSVNDMAKWLRLQLAVGTIDGKELLPSEVVEAIRVPHTVMTRRATSGPKLGHLRAYGLGWALQDHKGRLVVTHSGGLPGMTSRVLLVPDEGIGVVVLTNSESSASTVLAYDVIDRYLGGEPVDYLATALERQAAAQSKKEGAKAEDPPAADPPLPARKVAGRYTNVLMGRAEVSNDDGKLHLRLSDHGGLDCPLQPSGGLEYACTWSDPIFGRSTVTLDTRGKRVTGLRFKVRPEFIDPLEYAFKKR